MILSAAPVFVLIFILALACQMATTAIATATVTTATIKTVVSAWLWSEEAYLPVVTGTGMVMAAMV